MRRVGTWLARLIGAVPPKEMEGIRLEGESREVDGRRIDGPRFFSALGMLVPPGSVLVLEGGAHPPALADFLERNAVPPQMKVARGTLWPRAPVFHVAAVARALDSLAEITKDCAGPEICWHLHVYDARGVALEWYDAFDDDPMSVSKRIPLPALEAFCGETRTSWNDRENSAP